MQYSAQGQGEDLTAESAFNGPMIGCDDKCYG